MLGSWDASEIKVVNLPQKVASAFTAVTSEIVGADYQPVLYVGKQLVNGTNYCLLALKTAVAPNAASTLVKMVIHEDTDGKYVLKSISRIAL